MKSQIFTEGGGAGIGSYVIVLKNGSLVNASAEKIRWSYDNGENLFLSIIDGSTEEALLPLTGYVDNEGKLHLSGRDFDDNKTYEITVENEHQTVALEAKEGVTIGDTTIPTSGGGGGGTQLYRHAITVSINDLDGGESFDCSIILTTLSGTSLVGSDVTECINSNYITGLIAPYSEYPDLYYLISAVTRGSEPMIGFTPSEYNSMVFVFPNSPISADEVTPL